MTTSSAEMPGVPRPGEVVAGKYRVERILGAGGMGVVLAAWDLALERRVAVKFLLPAAAALPDAGARFVREARAAAALKGEHIAGVLDVGTLNTGAPYMVIEHLSGEDLGDVIKAQGPMPVALAVDLLLQTGEAIAEAHARGIIHRDLKPKNLFLTQRPDGTPLIKVLDFGLSKFQSADGAKDLDLTATSLVVGSVHYMSPEQVRGLKFADALTDIWALGVILYEMLTAERPFRGDSATAVAAAIMVDDPTPFSAFRSDVPNAIGVVVGRCLDKNPTRRIQTVTELARGLVPFGSPTAMRSFESIARLLPEPVSSATVARASLASSSGVGGMPAAPLPHPAFPSSPSIPSDTASQSAWGQTRRTRSSTKTAVLLTGAGLAFVASAVIAWVFLGRGPAKDLVAAAPAPAPAIIEAAPSGAVSTQPTSTGLEPAGGVALASMSPTATTATPVASVSARQAASATSSPAPRKLEPSAPQATTAQPPPPSKARPTASPGTIIRDFN